MSEATGQRGALGELHAITEAGARLVKLAECQPR
jgi:hypothetical protein